MRTKNLSVTRPDHLNICQKVNLIIKETIKLPTSFIIGMSFISGSITGSFLKVNFDPKKVKM